MVIVHNNRKRKPTGGRYKNVRSKRLAQKGHLPALTRIGEKKIRVKTIRGGNSKMSLTTHNQVNLMQGKKAVKAKILSVQENTASRHFVRRNIMTKGAIIETDKGSARVTNRPGQEGVINAVLVK